MKRKIPAAALALTLGAILLARLYRVIDQGWLLSLAITCGTFAYHFDMRLVVGGSFQLLMRNRANPQRSWYRVSAREQRIYKALHVRLWKKFLPAYAPELFDPKKHTWAEIAGAMCQAELVHETIAVLSFLPCLAIARFGAAPVFLLTSLASAMLDLCFAILQRYNRPRVLRLLEKTTPCT